MVISIELDGESYVLPKKTIKIAKLIDAAKATNSTEESYRNQYKLVSECIDKEKLNKLLDGDKLESADLVQLTILFLKIEQAYLSPVEEAREGLESRENEKMISAISNLGDAADKLVKLKDLKP